MPARLATTISAAALLIGAPAAWSGGDIRGLDRNGDRFVSYAELIRTAPAATRSDFAALDRNGDRRLSADELGAARARSLVARHGASGRASGAAALRLVPLSVADVDLDGDGRVSFEELDKAGARSLSTLRGN